jgi:hypothetical protein
MRARPALFCVLACVILSHACSSGSGSAPFEIVSPSSRNVIVSPGESVRFEIRANGGRTVEYLIDDTRSEPGPVFIFQPTSQHHVVQALIRSSDPLATPDIILFTVDIEAPGNLPPQITSFTVEPVTGEANDTEFTGRVTATDADGTVQSLSVDWGDGTAPSSGASSPFTATHTYAAEGTYTLTARAVDNIGVPATTSRQLTVAPHNDPPTGSLHSRLLNGAPPQGVAPLMILLETSGTDVDGTIVTWELDKDLGAGFEIIAPGEDITVSYPFREDHYMPALRLTDNLGKSTEIGVDQDIIVLRDVSTANSDYTVTGNSRFNGTGIAPAVWATGSDPLGFTIHVRDSRGDPVSGARVRVSPTRPNLVAPDGTALGSTVTFNPGPVLITDNTGTASGTLVTDVSTRVEAMPMIDFQPFGLRFEVDLSEGVWADLDLDTIAINANSTVSASGGRVNVPAPICPGQPYEIEVEGENRADAPGGGGPAIGKYTELRFSNGQPLPGYRPLQGFGSWRTNGAGEIRFTYTPVRADQSRLFLAWVDGQPLQALGTVFLKTPGECNGN